MEISNKGILFRFLSPLFYPIAVLFLILIIHSSVSGCTHLWPSLYIALPLAFLLWECAILVRYTVVSQESVAESSSNRARNRNRKAYARMHITLCCVYFLIYYLLTSPWVYTFLGIETLYKKIRPSALVGHENDTFEMMGLPLGFYLLIIAGVVCILWLSKHHRRNTPQEKSYLLIPRKWKCARFELYGALFTLAAYMVFAFKWIALV